MHLAALIFWLATAAGGLYMAGVAMRSGRDDSAATRTHLPSALIFGHGLLALFGLAVWGVHMNVEEPLTAWLALGTLVLVAAGGAAMFLVWHRDHAKRRKAADADRPSDLAEQQIPTAVVHLHGALAAVTIFFVAWVAFSYL